MTNVDEVARGRRDDDAPLGSSRRWPSTNRRVRHFARSALLYSILLVIILLVPWSSTPSPDLQLLRPEPAARDFSKEFMYGDYARPVRQIAPGTGYSTIDIDATIDALLQAHVSSYAYLISPGSNGDPGVSRREFDDLPAFAAAAGDAGIDVYVYLVPPSEAPVAAYAPFHWDYVAWADAIGGIAKAQHSIKGIMIDDFGINTRRWSRHAFSFTEQYVAQMMATARSKAGWLSFIPVLYYHDVVGSTSIASEYRNVMQAIVFPFSWSTAISTPGNTRQSNGAYQQGAAVSDAIACHQEPPCTQLRFTGTALGSTVVPQATLSARAAVAPRQARKLTFWAHSDAGRAGSRVNLSVHANGQALRSVRLKPGWHEYTYIVDNQQGQVEVDITLTRIPTAGNHQESVMIGDSSLEGSDASGMTEFVVSASPGVEDSVVGDVPMIFMTYAMPLGVENGIGAQPAYVRAVLGDVSKLRAAGKTYGSLVYCLNLWGPEVESPDSQNYEIVQQVYRRWRRGD